MNIQREVTCPLCTEAMDLTDQHFKPCKCGYQICVWCWNRLVEEAEKDEVLCPACRNPYDKEKIKGMTVGSDRLAEISFKEKQKMMKTKSKTSEMRFDPNEDRVVLRNLVYITGVPVNLANDETLRKREFFGQYGKILKIFIKPPRPGSPHYDKSSVVYVTFSKPEEAVRCIQFVNGFILNGSPLKACYGTSRYCHAWIQKKPCKNQDCAYLHYVAPQGDICTRDEVASVCTNKLQQCLGTTSLIPRCSGSFLPPATGCYCSCAGKPPVSSVIPDPFDCGRNLRSGDNEKSGAPSDDASCGFTVPSDRAYAGTAVCEGPLNCSGMSNSSFTSPAIREAHAWQQAQDEHQSKEQMLMLGNQMKGSGGLENHESSSQPYSQSGYPLGHTVPTFGASQGDDHIRERTKADPHQLVASRSKQLTPVAVDSSRQASSSIVHSATKRINCALSAPLCQIPVKECPVSSRQDSSISNMQAMTLRSGSAWSSGSSDLELKKLASRSYAKGTSEYVKGISTCDTGAIIGQKFGESSEFPDKVIATSHSEQEKLHRRYSSGRRQDFLLKHVEDPSDHKLVKDIVQLAYAWHDTGGNLRKGTISDETYVNSREYRVKSDISTLKAGLVEHLAKPQNLIDSFDDTNRGGDCSNVFNSLLPLSRNHSGVPVAILGGAEHTSGHAFQGCVAFDPSKENRQLHVGEKKAICREESVNRLTVNDLKNLEVNTNACGYSATQTVNESQNILRLHQTGPSISKSVISPPPRYPPGFPPRRTSDEGQSCSRPSSSGTPQLKISGNHPLINSSQKMTRSKSYFSVEPIDAVKVASKGELLQPALHLTSANYNSNLSGLVDGERRVLYQSSVGSTYDNSVEVDQSKSFLTQIALHGMKSDHGSQEALTFGSPTEMDSRVIGRRGQTGLANTENIGASVLQHPFLQPFSQRNNPEYQATQHQ